MASDEHKFLAQFIKGVHASLRKSSSEMGVEIAWQDHCNNKEKLIAYAECMQKLATTHWEENCSKDSNAATSRIKWAVELCYKYFADKLYTKYHEKEIEIAKKIGIDLNFKESFSKPLKLIDVGSCYNPFHIYDFFDVLAIDLCPANVSVLECDFLNVVCGSTTIKTKDKIEQLELNYFDVVTFCFLLEYIPSSQLRINACEKAYSILKPGGLLIISTPDSKHVGANCKIMKNWRYTLASIGFSRVKYEKYKHMHCMAFRKCLHKNIAQRWGTIHKEAYMEFALHIPQDFASNNRECIKNTTVFGVLEDFNELPFCYNEETINT